MDKLTEETKGGMEGAGDEGMERREGSREGETTLLR